MALTIQEMRLVAGADPDALPGVLVHATGWFVKPIVDSANDIHMNPRQLEQLRGSLPLELVGQVPNRPGVTRYRFALAPHHLEGGLHDAMPADGFGEQRGILRTGLGRRPGDGTDPEAGA